MLLCRVHHVASAGLQHVRCRVSCFIGSHRAWLHPCEHSEAQEWIRCERVTYVLKNFCQTSILAGQGDVDTVHIRSGRTVVVGSHCVWRGHRVLLVVAYSEGHAARDMTATTAANAAHVAATCASYAAFQARWLARTLSTAERNRALQHVILAKVWPQEARYPLRYLAAVPGSSGRRNRASVARQRQLSLVCLRLQSLGVLRSTDELLRI